MGNCAGKSQSKKYAQEQLRRKMSGKFDEYDRFYVEREAKVPRNTASMSTMTSTQVSARRVSQPATPMSNMHATKQSRHAVCPSKSRKSHEVSDFGNISHSKSARGYGSSYGGYEMVEAFLYDENEDFPEYQNKNRRSQFNIPRKRRDHSTGLIEAASCSSRRSVMSVHSRRSMASPSPSPSFRARQASQRHSRKSSLNSDSLYSVATSHSRHSVATGHSRSRSRSVQVPSPRHSQSQSGIRQTKRRPQFKSKRGESNSSLGFYNDGLESVMGMKKRRPTREIRDIEKFQPNSKPQKSCALREFEFFPAGNFS